MRALTPILLCAVATTAPVAAVAEQDAQLLCGVDLDCRNGTCAKPRDAAHRQVIVISPGGQQDHIEFGTYDTVFHVNSQFDIPKHRQNFLTGTRIYLWPTADGGTAQIKVHPRAAGPSQSAADGAAMDQRQRPFTYDRVVTVDGLKTQAHSSGSCIDPTNVVLGAGMVPGVIHSNENERYFSNPTARSELVAHCKLQPAKRGSDAAALDMWLVADTPGTACVSDQSSDGLLCFDMRDTPSAKLYESAFGTTHLRLRVRPNGAATYEDTESSSSGAVTRTTRYSGTCEKGPRFQ